MGNFAPNEKAKEAILNNIRDELGGKGHSHEQMYLDFAKRMGLDLSYETIDEKNCPNFIKDYHKGHQTWLRQHDWHHRLTAFAAIERLDNVDYTLLRNIASSFGLAKKELAFFNVHIVVQHFEDAADAGLNEAWYTEPLTIKKVFNFIGEYQLNIWQKISFSIFNYVAEKLDYAEAA